MLGRILIQLWWLSWGFRQKQGADLTFIPTWVPGTTCPRVFSSTQNPPPWTQGQGADLHTSLFSAQGSQWSSSQSHTSASSFQDPGPAAPRHLVRSKGLALGTLLKPPKQETVKSFMDVALPTTNCIFTVFTEKKLFLILSNHARGKTDLSGFIFY